MNGISALMKGATLTRELPSSHCFLPYEDANRRGSSLEPDCADTLILDFQPPEL